KELTRPAAQAGAQHVVLGAVAEPGGVAAALDHDLRPHRPRGPGRTNRAVLRRRDDQPDERIAIPVQGVGQAPEVARGGPVAPGARVPAPGGEQPKAKALANAEHALQAIEAGLVHRRREDAGFLAYAQQAVVTHVASGVARRGQVAEV